MSPTKLTKYPTNKSAQSVEQKDSSTTSSKKFKIEDLFNKRTLSQKRLFDKKVSYSKSSAPSNRIFDSVIFSGMEIDNMAMMIRTFNKWWGASTPTDVTTIGFNSFYQSNPVTYISIKYLSICFSSKLFDLVTYFFSFWWVFCVYVQFPRNKILFQINRKSQSNIR